MPFRGIDELWSGVADMIAGFTFPEEETAVSDDGWTVTVTISKVHMTPNGSEKTVGEKTYNYKKTPDGEAADARESRLRVKRRARQRALVYLDPQQHEEHKQKRRKRQPEREREQAAAVVIPLPGAQAVGAPVAAVVAGAGADDDAEQAQRRDWAMLRALKAGISPEATWAALSQQGLLDPMDWSVQDLVQRHAHVSQCVSLVAQLLGPELSAQKLAALHDICS